MLKRLSVITVLCGLVGCAGLRPDRPQEFSYELAGNVWATPDSQAEAGQISAFVPGAIEAVQSKLGHRPRSFNVLVCRSACFGSHVPAAGAAAAQTGSQIFVNADSMSMQPVQLQSVLSHELAHLVLEEQRGSDLHKVPEWANEALAVWVSGVGTEGCDTAPESVQRHPVCVARKASTWLDQLGQSSPHAQRCWVDQMVTGRQGAGCPPTGTIHPRMQ